MPKPHELIDSNHRAGLDLSTIKVQSWTRMKEPSELEDEASGLGTLSMESARNVETLIPLPQPQDSMVKPTSLAS